MEIYDQEFFQKQQSGSEQSALEIVPMLLKLFKPKSVVDVGCGIGTWLKVFAQEGVTDYLGVDGDYVDRKMLMIPAEKFKAMDLEQPIELGRKFDLAISLEVGEHLTSAAAAKFVDSITELAPVVLFSAAIPGQSGHKHKNEQWPQYWANLFAAKNYVAVDYLRPKIWNDNKVEWWYRQNAVLYIEKSVLARYPELQKAAVAQVPAMVHPNLYLSVNFAAGRGQFMVYVYKFLKTIFKPSTI